MNILYYDFKEDSYRYLLTPYLRKNKEKTECDFLKEKISVLKTEIERKRIFNELTDDEKLLIIKGNKPGYIKKDADIDNWGKQELNNLKESYKNDSNARVIFDFEMRLSRLPKQNLILNQKIKQIGNEIFPFRNKETLISFTTYTQQFIIDNYIDYSYLYQRLKKDNLIEFITHNNFFNWLKKNDFITENTLNEFISKESFRSLSKSFSASRDNNFNNTF